MEEEDMEKPEEQEVEVMEVQVVEFIEPPDLDTECREFFTELNEDIRRL